MRTAHAHQRRGQPVVLNKSLTTVSKRLPQLARHITHPPITPAGFAQVTRQKKARYSENFTTLSKIIFL